METTPPFRWARRGDCRRIAELMHLASGGVADYVWTTLADEYPGLTTLEIGARRYANQGSVLSYRSCVVTEAEGAVAGMMMAFPMAAEGGDDPPAEAATDPEAEPDVLAPYAELEVPGSFYICAMAVEEAHRGRGLGTGFLGIARDLARDQGCAELSLIAFAQNPRAIALYERHGFAVIDRRPVVPHPLIDYTGEALLMTATAAA